MAMAALLVMAMAALWVMVSRSAKDASHYFPVIPISDS
jgi:hypothetical protein